MTSRRLPDEPVWEPGLERLPEFNAFVDTRIPIQEPSVSCDADDSEDAEGDAADTSSAESA